MPEEPKSPRRKYMQDYFAKPENYEKLKKQVALYWRNHPEKRRPQWKILKNKLIEILGITKCYCISMDCCHGNEPCNIIDLRVLQFDHINGGGTQESKNMGGNMKMLAYYINHPEEAKEKLQLLCANCNRMKVYRNNEYNRKGRPRKY